jgi:hypothetical protein
MKATAVGVAAVLSWITWRLVEVPIGRFRASQSIEVRRRGIQVLAVSAAVLIVFVGVGAQTWDRQNLVGNRVVYDIENEAPLRDGSALFPDATYHRVSAEGNVVLLVGDSHADHLLVGLVEEGRKRAFGVSHVGYAGCLGVPVSIRLWGSPQNFPACQALASSALDRFLRGPAIRTVVFAARYSLYLTGIDVRGQTTGNDVAGIPREERIAVVNEAYSTAMRHTIAAGKRVVLALDVPSLDFQPAYCASGMSGRCLVSRETVETAQRDTRTVASQLQAAIPAMAVFDPTPLFCDTRWCYAQRNGITLYRDPSHLTRAGSELVASSLAPLLFEPMTLRTSSLLERNVENR